MMNVHSLKSLQRDTQRGAVLPVVLAAVAIIVLLAVAAWYLIVVPNRAAPAVPMQAPSAVAQADAPPPPDVESMSTAELLTEAGKAMRAQRLLAPPGNNAFEFYLKVLAREPGNRTAQDALRETFPFGANAAEQEINAGRFDEAQQAIDILAKADPSNYTLTILRSKLDAQRKLAARAEELEKQQELNQQRQGEAREIALAQQQQLEAQQREAEAAAAAEAQRRRAAAATPTPAVATPTPTPAASPLPILPARLVRDSTLRYPAQAARRRQEGWVDVEWTVNEQGDVVNARVVSNSGGHTFDRAALSLVEERKYEPATQGGKAVATTLRQTINFKL